MRHDKAAIVLRLARTLAASADGMTLDEIAAREGVNRRTAERLRDAVASLFPGLEAIQDGLQKRFRIPGGLDSFFNAPTADELAELKSTAASLAAVGGVARSDLLLSLAAKVEASLRPAIRRRLAPDVEALSLAAADVLQPGPRPAVDETLLATLRAALKGGAALRLRHVGRGGARDVTVSPWGLLFGRAYYLVGPAKGLPDPVLWRLDRIASAEPDGPAVLPPEDWSLARYAARSFGVFQEKPMRVVLRFPRSAASEAQRFSFHPTERFEHCPDGSLLVRFEAGGRQEIAWHLFTWGAVVEVMAPASLRRFLARQLALAAAHHDAVPKRGEP